MRKIRTTLGFFISFIIMIQITWSVEDRKEDKKSSIHSPIILSSKKILSQQQKRQRLNGVSSIAPVYSIPQLPIKPGIHESDNIEAILSFAIENFDSQDIVIFDVDEVLITGLDPYYFEHFLKKSSLHKNLFSQNENIIDQFFLYMFLSKSRPWTYMDERLPALIHKLQSQGIRCIANTALSATINPTFNIDVPTLRVNMLRSFDIDFSMTFPHILSWDFDTLDLTHIHKTRPLFKEGIIFSSETPKHITTLEFFKKMETKPRKVLFIDDHPDHARLMYEKLRSEGFECYSFCYSKKKVKPLRNYFTAEAFNRELKKLEIFLESLLNGGNVDEFFSQL